MNATENTQKPPQEAPQPAGGAKTPPEAPKAPEVKPEAPKTTPARRTPFEELDRLANLPKAPDKPAPPSAPKEPAPGKDDGKPPVPSPDKPAEVKPIPDTAPKDLRAALEEQKAEIERLTKQLGEVKTKEKAKAEDEDRKALFEQLESERKRREELESELKFMDYTRTDDYKSKWEKPIESALKIAFGDVAQLTIGDEGRPATADDFIQLMRMPVRQATAQANEWFGPAAQEILMHRRKVLDLETQRQEAVTDYKSKAGEREKAKRAEHAQRQERIAKKMQETSAEITKKYPHLFDVTDENDKEGREYLESGRTLADLAIMGNPDLTDDEMISVLAQVRNRAAAFGVLAHRNQKLQTQIEDLEKRLKEFETTQQPKEKAGAADGEPIKETWQEKLAKLAR